MRIAILLFLAAGIAAAQVPSQNQQDIYNIIDDVSADRIEYDVRKLAGFGTRNTFSDTISDTRGIGAARRWIKAEFDKISADCGGCLEVFYQKDYVTKDMGSRIPKDTWVVNVIAIQRGTTNPNDFVMMSGDIDSRNSDGSDFTKDAPGANDNASGMAGTIEAARVLTKRTFKNSIVYVGLSGEEQGLFGGKGLGEYAKKNNWNVIGFLNNDMIGNIEGVDGVIDNREFRIFSEPTDPTETERERGARRFYGGEVDGISRQLARYIHKSVNHYMPEMDPMMVYRLDRFGRGGHHRPFNDLGYPGIRIMEAHENYTQQHQDIRVEDGIAYGDVVEHVNFPYAKKLTAVNAINLAQLAWAPTRPQNVKIGGIVEADVKLAWDAVKGAKGYRIYWRDTTSPTWDYSRYVGDVTEFTLDGIVIDNYFFGVAAVGEDGIESIVSFPSGTMR
ncbi:M28 family peptidase [Nonlabens marinus]|uniref:Leucine aminopeptidase-related protein n=1 Tax=Nonlabens marinus S1-08 TaxID=1454201 RepID=W8W0N4_9FLAO|nr:M28 family metallopeptidase [Nonlabens marinus]BAO56631.1 leucine aminopeptidase-related protein [Nonlabens marinus S1-08]